jgi:CheY-like chemotaxis protein
MWIFNGRGCSMSDSIDNYISQKSQDPVILIVDDNDINRKLMSLMLNNMGFRTLCIEDGYYLTFSCKYFSHINAILMDMNMPKLDGYKTTRKIRKLLKKEKSNDYMPIIAVTVDENKNKCLKAGCDLHLLKPITVEKLSESLRIVGLHPKSKQ